jgi:lysozyme family protein
MVDIAALKAANGRRWSVAKPTRNFVSVAKSLCVAKSRYVAVQNRTGCPWYFIAIIHERESSQSWSGSLAQGDPWKEVSVHVPAGRGPFNSWEDAAVDALVNCPPYSARNGDWSSGGLLTELEEFNGLGYAMRGLPSPYVWAGTDQYQSGKFTSDGRFNPNVVDSQLGCAGLLIAMQAIDPTIHVGDPIIIMPETPPLAPEHKPVPPSITKPAAGSIGAFIASILSAVFGRKP